MKITAKQLLFGILAGTHQASFKDSHTIIAREMISNATNPVSPWTKWKVVELIDEEKKK